jgi:translation elongation factor EF-Ts
MISINIGNVTNEQAAEKLVNALEGRTYMNFHVALCPAYGSVDINVETDYTDDEAEFKDFVLSTLAAVVCGHY